MTVDHWIKVMLREAGFCQTSRGFVALDDENDEDSGGIHQILFEIAPDRVESIGKFKSPAAQSLSLLCPVRALRLVLQGLVCRLNFDKQGAKFGGLQIALSRPEWNYAAC